MTEKVTKEMLVCGDEQCGLYKHPKEGYVLIEYSTGDARFMPARQAKNWIKIQSERAKHRNIM